MTTAQEPVLDLDAMLEDLHNGFEDPKGGEPEAPEGDGTSAGAVDAEGGEESGGAPEAPPALGDLENVLPPGMVQFGDELLPQNEVQALLELNRRVKADPDTASRVRQAVIGQQQPPTTAAAQGDLPVWLDPDDQQAVYLYRQQERIIAEQEEMKRNEALRQQQALQQVESQRVTEVRDAFRASMKEFHTAHPTLDLEDLNKIANRAANMGLLENPEKVGGTLRGGIETALETAMWATPEYRDKVLSGATVPTREQKSADRKQKSTALSSSTGSVVRTQSQEPTPSTRRELMAGALEFLRSGVVSD